MLGFDKSFSPDGVWTYTVGSRYGNGDASDCPTWYMCGEETTTDEDACLKTNAVARDTRTTDAACIKTGTITVPIIA